MSIVKDAAQHLMKKVVEMAPDAWMPNSTPDPLSAQRGGLIGAPISRVDGALKVQGQVWTKPCAWTARSCWWMTR